MRLFRLFYLLLLLLMVCGPAQAWRHAISLGYGYAHSLDDNSYYNYGFFLNAKLYKFKKIDKTLIFTIDASLGNWWATTKTNNRLVTIALSGAFRAYFMPPAQHRFRPYLLVSFGPNYLSTRHFGKKTQGAHLSLQTTLGGGSEFTIGKHNFDFNMRLIHYCNAGIFPPNESINILYLASIGYLF